VIATWVSFIMSLTFSVILALSALGVAPLVAARGAKWPQGLRFLDGFVLAAVAGLVMLEVLPSMIRDGRILLPMVALFGFAAPTAVERLFQASTQYAHRVVLGVALVGLALHSALDGVALSEAAHVPGSLLGVGVILHQLPVGLMLWWVLRERPRSVMWSVFAMMGVGTLVGVAVGADIASHISVEGAAALEALIGGSLLHVVLHRGTAHGVQRMVSRKWESAGALFGVAFLTVVAVGFGSRATTQSDLMLTTFLPRLRGLAAESALPLLLAFAAAGVLTVAFPAGSIGWMRARGPWRQAMRGMMVGLPLPVCSCGVVPLYQGLIRRGAPPTAAMAFLVATPELGVDAFLLSLPLMGTTFAVLRLVAAAAVAVLVARIVGGAMPAAVPILEQSEHADLAGVSRVRAALHAGFGEMLDHTAPWILVGLVIAAAITPELLRSLAITRLPMGVDVVLFAALGIPTYVCASAATPLVAVLITEGVSPGAGLAFLLSGPATNLSTVGVLSRLHGPAIGVRFAVTVGLGAIGAGLLANVLLRGWTPVPLSGLETETPSLWQLGALIVLGALMLASLWRRGPRAFFGELSMSFASDPHQHAHGHDGDQHAHTHTHGHDHTHGHGHAHEHGESCQHA